MVASYSQCTKRMTSSHRRTGESIGTYDTILQAGVWLANMFFCVQVTRLEQRRIRDQLDSGGGCGAVNHCQPLSTAGQLRPWTNDVARMDRGDVVQRLHLSRGAAGGGRTLE